MTLEGSIVLGTVLYKLKGGSFLQMFVRPDVNDPSMQFFYYHLEFDDERGLRVFDGVKAYQNAPGLNLSFSMSTLYFEIRDAGSGTQAGTNPQRGILRVSLNTFLKDQLPSMLIVGVAIQTGATGR